MWLWGLSLPTRVRSWLTMRRAQSEMRRVLVVVFAWAWGSLQKRSEASVLRRVECWMWGWR